MRLADVFPRLPANLKWEAQFDGLVCGVDEVGRGPWAGPVVTAACVLKPGKALKPLVKRLKDSKQTSAKERESIFDALHELRDAGGCWFALAEASVEEIDALNILHASLLAMQRAVENLLAQCPETIVHVLVDGNRLPKNLSLPATPIVRGDALSASISAASILAKVTRDRQMAALAEAHPHYAWERNAGYGTADHQRGLATHGVTLHHRRSFRPIQLVLNGSLPKTADQGEAA